MRIRSRLLIASGMHDVANLHLVICRTTRSYFSAPRPEMLINSTFLLDLDKSSCMRMLWKGRRDDGVYDGSVRADAEAAIRSDERKGALPLQVSLTSLLT